MGLYRRPQPVYILLILGTCGTLGCVLRVLLGALNTLLAPNLGVRVSVTLILMGLINLATINLYTCFWP